MKDEHEFNKKGLRMNEKLIKTMDLKNGMRLKFYDASRKLAGDRWLVSLIVRMEIPVANKFVQHVSPSAELVKEMRNLLGDPVLFEQQRERNFVDEAQKDEVFKEIHDIFLNHALRYLSHEKFPEQYVLKRYKAEVKKRSWYHEDC